MPNLVANRAHKSTEPQLHVENKLKAGTYRFHLVVVDDAGNQSDPAELEVTVKAAVVVNPRDILRDRVVIDPAITERLRVPGRGRIVTPIATPKPTPKPSPQPSPAIRVTPRRPKKPS